LQKCLWFNSHKFLIMSIYFLEVILSNGLKKSFDITLLEAFQELRDSKCIRLYLKDTTFDIIEDYQKFVNKLNKIK
jgi:hypothetical protein